MGKGSIPIYSIEKFKRKPNPYKHFQVEEFDAHRHFEVEYPHRHDFFEILYLTKGSGKHNIDLNSYEIEPNSIFFLSPGQIHSIEFSTDIEGYIFLFTAEYYQFNKSNENKLLELPFFFRVDGKNEPLVIENEGDASFLKTLFIKGCSEMDEQHPDTPDIIASILELILLSCNKLYSNFTKPEEINRSHLLVKRFKQLLEENYTSNPGVKDLADMLSVTPNHLTDTVRAITGKTSNELIDEKIIIEIKRLLVHTDFSATQISHQLGFKDQSYFSRYFKKLTGMTPGTYRKEKNRN
jgi:AraC family transcriptional activator of pobA